MSTQPQSLIDLGAYWTANGGVNLGIIGDQKHCAGYHLGRDRIYGPCACKPDGTCEPGQGDRDYSVIMARDKAGLTNAASAIDLGRLKGSLTQLYDFSRWLVAECQHAAVGYRDVREIIYSPDGVKVQRYSGVDGQIHTGAGNGDGSHTTHTHISYFRDSEKRDKRPLFAPYFELPDTGVDMPALRLTMTSPYAGTATVVGDGHSFIRVWDGLVYPVTAGWQKAVYAKAKLAADFTTPGGAVIPHGTPVVVIGDDEAVLLEKEVTLKAAPTADTKHRVALAVDGTIQIGTEVTV